MSFDLKQYLVENKLTRNSRLLPEVRTEKQKYAVVQIEHKPTGTIFYSYTENPASYLQQVLKYRSEEDVIPGNESISNLLRQDTEIKNYQLDVTDVYDSLDKAREEAAASNKNAGVKYKLGRRPKEKMVPVLSLAKGDSKQLNDFYIIKVSALSDPKYKDAKVDKSRTYTYGGDTYYKVLNLNVERV